MVEKRYYDEPDENEKRRRFTVYYRAGVRISTENERDGNERIIECRRSVIRVSGLAFLHNSFR